MYLNRRLQKPGVTQGRTSVLLIQKAWLGAGVVLTGEQRKAPQRERGLEKKETNRLQTAHGKCSL